MTLSTKNDKRWLEMPHLIYLPNFTHRTVLSLKNLPFPQMAGGSYKSRCFDIVQRSLQAMRSLGFDCHHYDDHLSTWPSFFRVFVTLCMSLFLGLPLFHYYAAADPGSVSYLYMYLAGFFTIWLTVLGEISVLKCSTSI